MIIIRQDKVHFTVQKAVQEVRLQVFDQPGSPVYDSGVITEPELNWPLQRAMCDHRRNENEAAEAGERSQPGLLH